MKSVKPDGSLGLVVGSLAELYERLGGEVRYVGKPHDRIFAAALEQLRAAGVSDKKRIAMVGDSLHHDVSCTNQPPLEMAAKTGKVAP